jgi:soluble lytic murein transglycosylase-like protein
MGVMQLMPGTARQLGVDARDVASNIEGGALYLSQMLRRFEGDVPRALAAYNAGPEAVQRYGGIPPYAETQAYVRAILGRLGAVGGLGAHAE